MKILKNIAALLLLLTLISCGGGGGGGGPSYSVSTTSINFTAGQNGTTPAAQQVNVSVGGGTVYIAVTQNLTGASASFSITGATTGVITITPSAPTMAPGTYGGTVTVYGCSDAYCNSQIAGSPKVINVTYVITSLTASSTGMSFHATSGANPASQNLTLTSSAGPASWTSSITYNSGASGWLNLAAPSGSTLPATIAVSAASSSLAVGVYQATVTFNSVVGTASVVVNLTVSGPGVNYVSPYVGTTNVGGSVIIRGHGFQGVSSPQVKFGTTPASSFTVVSDTEIQATYPALAQGTYAVTVGNGSGTLSTRANLVVVNAPGYTYTSLTRANTPGGAYVLIYDAERSKLYLLDQDRNRVEAYAFNGSTWALSTTATLATVYGNRGMAITPDGSKLIVTGGNQISLLDLNNNLAETDVSAQAFLTAGNATDLNLIAMANDGTAIGTSWANAGGTSLYSFDVLTSQFTTIDTASSFINSRVDATGDGSRLLVSSYAYLAVPTNPIYKYDASSYAFSQLSILADYVSLVSADRTGSKTIVTTYLNAAGQATNVYNSSFSVLGTLPLLNNVVISPDGAYAYTYVDSTKTIHKYNLNGSNGSGGFNEVGTGTVLADAAGIWTRMTISPDGGSLFIAGSSNVLIVPAP